MLTEIAQQFSDRVCAIGMSLDAPAQHDEIVVGAHRGQVRIIVRSDWVGG